MLFRSVIVGETSHCGNIGHNNVFITSKGTIGYLPSKNDAKNKIIGRKIKSKILIISFDSLSIIITYKFDSLSPEPVKISFA